MYEMDNATNHVGGQTNDSRDIKASLEINRGFCREETRISFSSL